MDLSLWKKYQASRSAVDASKANSLSTREQVILLVVSQYIGTLRAVANVELPSLAWNWPRLSMIRPPNCKKKVWARALTLSARTSSCKNEKQRLIEAETIAKFPLWLSKLLNLDPRQKVEWPIRSVL